MIYQSESYSHSTTKTIFGSYALDGYLWWFSKNSKEEISAFDLPAWVNHNLSSDGYHYADSNDQPYEVKVRTVFGEKVLEHKGVLDAGYQDENKTIPNNLFTERIDELNSENLPQGLYSRPSSLRKSPHTDEHRKALLIRLSGLPIKMINTVFSSEWIRLSEKRPFDSGAFPSSFRS